MSYILESLKKSDKERRDADGNVSGEPLFEYVPEFLAGGQVKRGWMPLVFAIIFFMLVSASLWFFLQSSNISPKVPVVKSELPKVIPPEIVVSETITSEVVIPEVKTPKQAALEEAAPERVVLEEVVKKTVSPDVAALYKQEVEAPDLPLADLPSTNSVPVSEPISPNVSQEKDNISIPSIYELSPALQDSIPSINYGAHVYATDNRSGFVILNGAKYKAGAPMRNGVYVEKVQLEEVVLSYQGVVFALPAMKSWQSK